MTAKANQISIWHAEWQSINAHVLMQMYQEFNDFLLNLICSPELEFQTDNLPPEIVEELDE